MQATIEQRARISTMPPAPTLPGSATLLRRTFRPKALGGRSYTLTLFDSGAPHPAGGFWLAWRLYQHDPSMGRRGRLLFAGADQEPPSAPDGLLDAARAIMERLTVRPGDLAGPDDPTALYSPDQLAFAVRDAAPLREAVRQRLGWRAGVPFNLRADLEATYSSKTLATPAGRRHRCELGVLRVEADSKQEARQLLAAGVLGQCSAEPELEVGQRTRDVYALWPLGTEWVIQLIHPNQADVVGQRQQFTAANREAARERFRVMVAMREALPAVHPAPTQRRHRASARAVA